MDSSPIHPPPPTGSLLQHVLVRPILPGERARWEALMRQHHYLGFTGMVGASLRYVAECGGQWLALLGWQAAALKCRPRDRWIGWPPVLHYQRLHLIANNCRFLILPEVPSRPPQTQTLPWSWGAAIVCYHETESPMPNSRIEPLKKVLAIDPNDDVAWFGLGKAYMDDGNFEEAAMALRQCVTVKPAYSAAYFALAQSLHTLHRLEECRTVITTGIEVSTKNGDAMVTKNLEALKSSLPQ